MNNQTLNQKTTLESLKKPFLAIFLALFILLAMSLVFLPQKASAATTTTSTSSTIIIPIAGYYYYIDQYGNAKPCDMPNCGAYGPFANAQGFADFRSTYKPTPTYGTGYGTSYQGYVNEYKPYSYSTQSTNSAPTIAPIYSVPEYKPYEKVGNTLKVGKAKTSPKYIQDANGLLATNSVYAGTSYGSYGSGSNYGATNSGNSGFKQTGNTGGFVMTSSAY